MLYNFLFTIITDNFILFHTIDYTNNINIYLYILYIRCIHYCSTHILHVMVCFILMDYILYHNNNSLT